MLYLVIGESLKRGYLNGVNSQLPGAALTVQDVSVVYDGQAALHHVTFEVARGQLVGVLGPNGAGKSTLLNVITGLERPSMGSVLVYGHPPEDAKRLVAYVPQHERVNWRFPMTAYDLVMMGRCTVLGLFRRPSRLDRERVLECLERVGLTHLSKASVGTLSGGERQRAFVARALAQEAELVLLDEAFSGVDVGSQESLVEILLGLRNEGKTIVLVTHDLTGLARRFDACLCLNHHVCAYGPPGVTLTPELLRELYGAHVGLFAGGI